MKNTSSRPEDLKFSRLDCISMLFFSGAQGEYAGLRAIMAYLHAKGQTQRKVT